jgi:hypothetical protein
MGQHRGQPETPKVNQYVASDRASLSVEIRGVIVAYDLYVVHTISWNHGYSLLLLHYLSIL